MPVFTVTKPVGTSDSEFQAYVDLLEEIGIDITNVPRTPEPGTGNRWLYVWSDRDLAGRFARELRFRTRDDSWMVHEFELPVEETGPLAPLVILSSPTADGTVFELESNSQARIMAHFPNARLPGNVFFSTQTRRDFERQHGPIWNQVAILLTGIPEDALNQMGGYRVQDSSGRVLHETIPEYGT